MSSATPEPTATADAPPTTRLGPWNDLGDLGAPGVFVLVAQPANVNIGLVVGERACLLIDTGSSPAQGREIRAGISDVTDQPLTHVVVTHAHWDHLDGLAAFADLVTIGHASVRLGGEHPMAGLDELVLPNSPMTLIRGVDLGERWIELTHLGRAHTDGDVIVKVGGHSEGSTPERRIAGRRPVAVFTGDLIEQGADPQLDPSGSLKNWSSVLDAVIAAGDAATLFIPGHGDPLRREGVADQRGALATTWGLAESLAQTGRLDRAIDDLRDGQGDWPFSVETMRAWLPLITAELDAAGVRVGRRLPLV